MNSEGNGNENFLPFERLPFSKASPEMIRSILRILEAEVEDAASNRRNRSLNRAFFQLSPSVADLVRK